VAFIPGSIRHARLRTKKRQISVRRQPPLELGGWGYRRFLPITEDHPAYLLAAFAHHHNPEDEAAERALWTILAERWPERKGRAKHRYDDHVAFVATKLGAGAAEIAQAWVIEPNSAEKKIRAVQDRSEPLHERAWIRTILGEEARHLLGDVEILPEPLDPGRADAFQEALGLAIDPDELEQGRRRFFQAVRLAMESGAWADRIRSAAPRSRPKRSPKPGPPESFPD
jgi:hypothetical protein